MSSDFPPLSPDDPREIAGYPLLAVLGQGGMGKVYLSVTRGGRPLAVKTIRPEFAADPEFRSRFRQEVEAAQRVASPYTAALVDADPDAPAPWLATAYVAGPSLQRAVRQWGPLPGGSLLHLAAGIADALTAIHAAGVVHRDLKPSNVLLAADGPRVIDFGIARAAEATSLTVAGARIGTPAFMAPEQVRGEPVTSATDVFALGQVLVFGATGRAAFGEGATDTLFHRIVSAPPNLDGCEGVVRALAEHCLAKDPAARPSTPEIARLARAELPHPPAEGWLPEALAVTLPGYVPPPATLTSLPPATLPPGTRGRAGTETGTGTRVRTPLLAGASAGAAVLLAGGVLFAFNQHGSPPAHPTGAATGAATSSAPARSVSEPSPTASATTAAAYAPEYQDVSIDLPGGTCTEGSSFQYGLELAPTGPKVHVDANDAMVYDCLTNDHVPELTIWDWTGQGAVVSGDPAPAACVNAVEHSPLGAPLRFADLRKDTRLCVVTTKGQVLLFKVTKRNPARYGLTFSVSGWSTPSRN
ncbi:serine/threonine protein kinase [Actinomadura logoneensis]|uniref:Serine/threonine protein kinase n=1 Tax=Actinomadura logoneensis TaxID=2293572 RepID=A0A372JBK9_9ACTN|nr:serine/threonine-protein kinase [Actinomadura logoneensis]RFU37395.1 serine/threonine protein kinase [Actinomadura logoneensis]